MQELQAFLSDLGQWTNDVKEKDRKLTEKRTETVAAPLPPVRGRATAPSASASAAAQPSSSNASGKAKAGSAAGHTYDHSNDKWCVWRS